MDEDVVRRRVADARVARLATVRPDGAPHLVPICFAVAGDVIYTAIDDKPKTTYALQRVRNVRANPRVSVLVDHYEEAWARVWWARVDGDARVLDGGVEHARAIDSLREKYPQYDEVAMPGAVLAIDARRWRGWSYDGSVGTGAPGAGLAG